MMIPEKFTGKRLVIFGCGYVGAQVARDAVAAGVIVTALTRNEKKAAALREMGVSHIVLGSLESTQWHSQIEPEQDFAVNCVSSGRGDINAYKKSYFEGMQSVLEWGKKSSATLVYTGSTSVYAQSEGEVVTEQFPANPENEKAGILRQTEKLLEEESAGSFSRWFILRLAGIYGPGRHYLLNQLREGQTVFSGSGQHRLNLIHRDDISSAIWACLAAPSTIGNEIFNCSDDHASKKQDVLSWLAQQLDVDPPVWGNGGESLGGRLVRNRVISHEKLTRLLGWRPTYPTFHEGYKQILK